ncbi:MAG: AAA family ATPase [Clostridia bacterium]|nr:AAA family ATPase [Clostridia bacterium]
MMYGCIAEHLGHSFSALIHARLADYTYELCELTPCEVDGFMKEKAFRAINVTIPYKQTVIPYLDEVDEIARRIGAVNTVVNRDGRLYGYNTDFAGMCALIERLGLSLKGKKVAVLGTGGTSKTARAVAAHLGAKEILVVSRTAREGIIDYAALTAEHTDTEILINTTPVGMYPDNDGLPVVPELFPRLCGVVDAVYNPLSTVLVSRARAMGIPAEGGLYMLVAQAAFAVEHFLDVRIPREKIDEVYADIVREKRNIVLVGMPGCGKTTLGRMLANRLGMGFVDCDEEIVRREGMPIPQIFAERGESAFRDCESAAIREAVAPLGGYVIATGGGAILREENVFRLRQNGLLIFMDRPLDQIAATGDRPLSSDREMLETRYRERYPKYRACADIILPIGSDAEENTQKLINALK